LGRILTSFFSGRALENPNFYIYSVCRRHTNDTLEAFESKKESYVSSTDLEEWEIAKQHARQVEIYIKSSINEAADYSYQRDLGQAENIKWALDFEGEDSKIIVWAHNIHINNGFVPEVEKEGERFLYTEMMGNHLKNWYQDKVRIVGFFFNQGQFTALDNEIPSQGMAVFNVEEAKNGSLENRLIKAGLSNAFLDLSQVPSKGLVHNWINEPIPTRYSWGGFKATKAEDFYWTHTLGSEFDAIVFLDKTTATVPIDSADYENVWLLDKKLSHPTNLDFEENEVGEAPNGWITWSKFERLGVTMTTSDQAHQGNKSLMIHRPKDLAYGEIGPNVVQQISAQPFLGKRIRFTATAKSELDNSTFALIHLKVDADFDDSVHSGEPSLFDSLDNYRIKHSEWTLYTIEAEVPENAHSITYSVHLRDFGTVWLDDVKIEIIE
jgi:erythromycin esterase